MLVLISRGLDNSGSVSHPSSSSNLKKVVGTRLTRHCHSLQNQLDLEQMRQLEHLQPVTHVLTPRNLPTLFKSGVPWNTMSGFNNNQEAQRNPGQRNPLVWHPSLTVHFLQHQCTVVTVCTIYKMDCSNSVRVLDQHFPNL